MKVVIDTNCFISCIGKKSIYRPVFDAFLKGDFTLCVSTEILLEYEEMFSNFWGSEIADNIVGVLIASENVSLIEAYYNFNLVGKDPDDNKFADIYVSSASDFLVSDDKNLLALNNIDFPVFRVIGLKEFCAKYLK